MTRTLPCARESAEPCHLRTALVPAWSAAGNLTALFVCLWIWVALLAPGLAEAQEEFVGPFASWGDAKGRYGAVGNGVADDTAALQRALDELGMPGRSHVLFLPAGTYRITSTLFMTSKIWVSMIGADPGSVTIRWNGPAGGTMLLANGVRYSRWGRITWDGNGTAATAVHHQWDGIVAGASTGNEHADEVFRNVGVGLRAGNPATNRMDAEVMVLRSHFINCSQAGVSIESWNALDWFIWDSYFQDSNIGVTNEFGAGNFHVYYSSFRNSTVADITIRNTMYFSLRGNTSVGSRKFYLAYGVGMNSAQVSMENNTILDTQDSAAITARDLGPLMSFDNVIRSRVPGPALHMPGTSSAIENVSIGNTFTVDNPIVIGNGVDETARVLAFDNRTVDPAALNITVPPLPAAPPSRNRIVIDVPAGSSAGVIQQMINTAAGLTGQKPVVHLPSGEYSISQSLVVPAESDLQIVGDGAATRLSWSGTTPGPLLHLLGPSHAIVRDLAVLGRNAADGILIDNADQPDARVYGQQLYITSSSQFNILADHLNAALVEFRGLVHDSPGIHSIHVIGGDQPTTGRVNVFGGASSSSSATAVIYNVANGGKLLVQDMWYEGSTPRLARLTDRGSFTLQGARVAPGSSTIPAIEVNGFHGNVTLAGVLMNNGFLAANAQSDSSVLLLGIEGNQPGYVTRDSTFTRFALLNSHLYTPGSGSFPVANQGAASADFLRTMLSDTRTQRPGSLAPLPAGVTDVKLFRVGIEQTTVGLRITALGQ